MGKTKEKDSNVIMMQGMSIASPAHPQACTGGSYEEALVDLRGKYEVQRCLQKALFGTVLLVSVQKPDDFVVMKAVSKDLSSRNICCDGTQVFEDHSVELEVLRKARASPHPNVLALCPERYQMESARTRYTALPYLAGGELFEVVEAGGAVHADAARELICGLAQGLDHLHRVLGFVHNDVSLENVLLSADGRPVVCDYGLASVVGAKWDSARRISGKLPYQAPEIYFGTARTSEAKGDVFSLGVSLFVLLTGIPPFDLPDPVVDQRYNYIQLGRMGELLDLWGKSVPAEAVDLLTRMLAHDPRQRISMPEVLSHPWIRLAANTKGVSPAAAQPCALVSMEEEDCYYHDDDDFVFNMDMELEDGREQAPPSDAQVRQSAPVTTPAKSRSGSGMTNSTASPDSVFSFEEAYHKHMALTCPSS